MKRKIHILGAAGSGTSTLGTSLSKVLPHTHLDIDDYFWITKHSEESQISRKKEKLKTDLSLYKKSILSGTICGWGDAFKSEFDLVVFLWIPQDIRLARLKQREFQRYGNEILAGGSKHDESKSFLEWAALYDNAGVDVRSKVLHEHWMAKLSCPILRIEEDYSVDMQVGIVLDYLKANY